MATLRVWVNGTQNVGLVNFRRPGLAFTIVQISSSKNGREDPKLLTKIALMKWNTDFRLEHSFWKNRTTFSGVPLLPKIFHWNDAKSRSLTFQPVFAGRFRK